MPGDNFCMIFAPGTFFQVWTVLTDFRITFVFPVPLPIGGAVFENLIVWTDVKVVVFIKDIVLFIEKSIFGMRSGIGEVWLDSIENQLSGNRRCFISGIGNDGLRGVFLQLAVQFPECAAVMFIAWSNRIVRNPAVSVTGTLNTVGKN